MLRYIDLIIVYYYVTCSFDLLHTCCSSFRNPSTPLPVIPARFARPPCDLHATTLVTRQRPVTRDDGDDVSRHDIPRYVRGRRSRRARGGRGRGTRLSQSVSQSSRGRERSEARRRIGRSRGAIRQVGAAIFTPFTPHDAATVRARSIRHSKQSARYVQQSSQDASDDGRPR
ncbi:hypothetical protein PUN28_019466 [Cardiocondyla obscurior]|uniref:Secreted protein n=1 Tax=Cardiocondyla obscurior TaxID=286306 RepID=A0AAW2EDX7_9HYME